MIRSITQVEIDELVHEARKSSRKRVILRLHQYEDPVQRMINALLPGSYVAPHKHENPDKVELFSILKGRIAVLQFSERGAVEDIIMLDAHGPVRIIDIAPRTYHNMIAVEPSAVLEIIQGPYDPETHKKFATWAPLEDNPKANDYLMYLQSIVHNWKF